MAASAAAAVVVGMLAGVAPPAAAGPNDPYDLWYSPNVEWIANHPIPASAPQNYDGDILPVLPGTLGVPTYLFNSTTGAQSLEVPGDSSAWSTTVRTWPTNFSNAQKWYFQYIGDVSVTNVKYGAKPAGTASSSRIGELTESLRMYKVIHYNASGTYTCLDAFGGSGAVGSTIKSDVCNSSNATQPNQLWVLPSNPINVGASRHNVTPWQTAVTSSGTASVDEENLLISVASLVASGYRVETAPLLGAPNNGGVVSDASLINGTASPAGPGLAAWDLVRVPAPNTQAPSWNQVQDRSLFRIETVNSGAGLDSNWRETDIADNDGGNQWVIPVEGMPVKADDVPLSDPLDQQMEQGRYWVEYPAGTVTVKRMSGSNVVTQSVDAINVLQAGDIDKAGYSDFRTRCLDVIGPAQSGSTLATYECDPNRLSQRWIKVRVGVLANNYALVNVAGLLNDGTGTRLLDDALRVSLPNPGNGGCCAIIGSPAVLQAPNAYFSQTFGSIPTSHTPWKLTISG